MNDLMQVKEILYDILLQPDNAHENVSVNQQMGVSLTNAVRKDGVNIIQYSQISKNVVSGVAKALRTIDMIQETDKLSFISNHIKTKVIEDKRTHLEIALDEILSKEMSWKEMKEFLVKKLFIRACKMYPEKKDLAEHLCTGMQNLKKLMWMYLEKNKNETLNHS